MFDKGGKRPLKSSHSVIDNPESVSLVNPPTIIILETSTNITINQKYKYLSVFLSFKYTIK